ncbi:MAG TPA: hypothetical protein VKT73_13075 [Xanthobacteraceae bacterium]|nr:hypothetical protein [Xanthobacteraceae bacterium]
MTDIDLTLPDFLNRKLWTPERIAESERLWKETMKRGRELAKAATQREARERELRRLNQKIDAYNKRSILPAEWSVAERIHQSLVAKRDRLLAEAA